MLQLLLRASHIYKAPCGKNAGRKDFSSRQLYSPENRNQKPAGRPLRDGDRQGAGKQQSLDGAATLFPHGVAAMDLGLEDQRIPETSDNFAMIDMGQDEKGSYILFTANIRSSLATKKAFLKN